MASTSTETEAPRNEGSPGAGGEASVSVGKHVHAGLKWVSLSLAWVRAMQFVVTVVLVRILGPEAFGVVALALAVTMILAALRELGLGQALIQRPDQGEEDTLRATNATFHMSMAINAVLFVVAFLAAPLASQLPKMTDEVVPVLRVLLIPLTFAAFGSTAGFLLQRRFQFGKQSFADGVGAATNTVVAIGMALAGCGVWSLVGGIVVSRFVTVVLLLRFSGWFPGLHFCRKTARELFRFGKYLWGFGLVNAVGGHIDRFVLGSVLGAGGLGLYTIAYNFCQMPANQVASLVNRVAFPALSRKQSDPAALRAGFMKALSHVAVLAMPFAYGVVAVAYEFVPTVYGAKVVGAAPIMQVFAFYGTLLAVASVAGPVLQAINRPDVIFYTGMLHFVILIPCLYYGAQWAESAAVGVAVGALIPRVVSSVIAFMLIRRYLDLGYSELLSPLIRSTCAASIMYAAVWAFRTQIGIPSGFSDLWILTISVGLGVATYVVATALCNRAMLVEFLGTFRKVLGARSGS